MAGLESFSLGFWDYVVFAAYFVVLSGVGIWAGRKKKADAEDYFLAGRSLPWWVVGTSFIGANISSEHFIGMIGAAYVFGICVAMSEWSNIWVFSLLIWVFIPFLLISRIVTMPEFLERRFGPVLRQVFAIMTLISNVVAFLAAVLYGGGVVLQALFGWNLWFAVILLGAVAGAWSIYGGLKTVAYTEFLMVIIMFAGGVLVTVVGLYALSGDDHSLLVGWKRMIAANRTAIQITVLCDAGSFCGAACCWRLDFSRFWLDPVMARPYPDPVRSPCCLLRRISIKHPIDKDNNSCRTVSAAVNLNLTIS